jgi:hypothetical protein
MKLSLRNISVFGFIGITLVILKNLFAQLFPAIIIASTSSGSSLSIGYIIEYSLVGIYYITLLIYLFKKRFIIAGSVWILQVIMFCWYFNFVHNFEMYNGDLTENIAQLTMNVKIVALMTTITGSLFIISHTRRRIWLRIFGYMLILSAIPMFKHELMIEYMVYYTYLVILIPAPLLVNYLLEMRRLKADKSLQGSDNDVLDVDIESIVEPKL